MPPDGPPAGSSALAGVMVLSTRPVYANDSRKYASELGLRRGRMRSAGAAPLGRRLLLDLVEKRKVTARHVLDLLAKRPHVTKRTAARLEPILPRRHRIGESDEGLLDHREPLPDGDGHRIDAFLAECASWDCQTRSEHERCSEALAEHGATIRLTLALVPGASRRRRAG